MATIFLISYDWTTHIPEEIRTLHSAFASDSTNKMEKSYFGSIYTKNHEYFDRSYYIETLQVCSL